MENGPAPEESQRGAADGTPHWVKVFGAVAALLIILAIVVVVSGRGGDHGPGRHAPDGGAAHTSRPAGVTHSQP